MKAGRRNRLVAPAPPDLAPQLGPTGPEEWAAEAELIDAALGGVGERGELGGGEVVVPADESSAESETDFGSAPGIELRGCRLTGVRLADADLSRTRWTDVVLDGCDLSGALLADASLRRVSFADCRLQGTIFSGAHLADVRFAHCHLGSAELRMATAERVALLDCRMTDIDLYGARLPGLICVNCDLTGAELSKSDWTGAALHGSTLHDLRAPDALRGATIDQAQQIPLGVQLVAAAGIVVDDELALPDL